MSLLADLTARLGAPCPPSRWFQISQAMIDAHAEMVEDTQWIHTDPARAEAAGLGGTMAHGFLTLSLLSAMAYDAMPAVPGETRSVNYGFDRLRFLSPVPAGGRVRGHFTLRGVDERRPGEMTLTWEVSVELAGAEKPALAARWINRHYLDDAA